MSVYPLTFDPIFKDYVWGGRNLADRLGRRLPDGNVAESWEIAAHPDGSTRVNAGPLKGKTLLEIQLLWGIDLVGSHNPRFLQLGRFPLLIKLLDANRWLSVQVHPDDAYALANENDLGKTEMWIVLHAEPHAELIYGFRKGVTREAFARAIADNLVDPWLHHVPVQTGDVIFVPAGTVHALGPGTIVAEIQQNSNTTYRIYDWGRPRPIHVQQALDVLDFAMVEPRPLNPTALSGNGGASGVDRSLRLFRDRASHFPGRQRVLGVLQRQDLPNLGSIGWRSDHFLVRRPSQRLRRRLGAVAGGTGRFPDHCHRGKHAATCRYAVDSTWAIGAP